MVIAIIGILVALLLPAIQSAREAARRIQCTNNLKQIGVAILNYESAHKRLPLANTPNFSGSQAAGPCGSADLAPNVPGNYLKAHFILSFILPFLEQQPLYDQIDFKLDWFDVTVNSKGFKNREVTAIDLPEFLCPSAEGRPGTFTTDYFVITDIQDDNYCLEVEGGRSSRRKNAIARSWRECSVIIRILSAR